MWSLWETHHHRKLEHAAFLFNIPCCVRLFANSFFCTFFPILEHEMKEKHSKTVFSFERTQFKSFHANQPLFQDVLDIMLSNHGPFEAVFLCRLPKHPGYFAMCIYQLFMIVCWKVLSTKHATNSSANSRAITGRLPVNRYLPLLLRNPSSSWLRSFSTS